jgi:hypothetical protein
MVSSLIDRMTCPAQNHADILLRKQPFLKPHRNNPMRQWEKTTFALYISDQRSEHSRAFFEKTVF